MKRLLVTGADLFDYIIIDLPPLLSMVDGRAIEPLVTQFLYIVEWGTVSDMSCAMRFLKTWPFIRNASGSSSTRSTENLSHGTLLATRMVTNTTCTFE